MVIDETTYFKGLNGTYFETKFETKCHILGVKSALL